MLIYGTLIGSYLPYLPFVKDRFGIGESAFSMGFLLGAIGALASLPLAPWVIKKVGTRKAALVMSVFYLSTVGFMMSAPSFALFLVLFLLVGLTISTWEIAVNSQASAIEDQMGKPVISSIHGFWSLGVMTGSGVIAIFNVGTVPQFGLALVSAIAGALAARALPRLTGEEKERAPPRRKFADLPAALLRTGHLRW